MEVSSFSLYATDGTGMEQKICIEPKDELDAGHVHKAYEFTTDEFSTLRLPAIVKIINLVDPALVNKLKPFRITMNQEGQCDDPGTKDANIKIDNLKIMIFKGKVYFRFEFIMMGSFEEESEPIECLITCMISFPLAGIIFSGGRQTVMISEEYIALIPVVIGLKTSPIHSWTSLDMISVCNPSTS